MKLRALAPLGPLTLALAALLAPTPALAKESASDLLQAGKAYALKGQDAKAAPVLEQAVQADPKNAEAHYQLGLVYSRMEKPQQAEAHLKQAVELEPKNYSAYLLWGMSRDLQSDPAGALAIYEKAIAVEPKRPEAYREAGASELLLGKSEAAAKHLEQAYALSNHDADVAADYGYALVRAKRCPEGEKILAEAVDNDPRNADLQAALADAYACQNKAEPAIAAYGKATRLDAKNGQAWFHMGLLKAKKGDKEGAKEALLHAHAVRPQDAEVAEALKQLGVDPNTAVAPSSPPGRSGPVVPKK